MFQGERPEVRAFDRRGCEKGGPSVQTVVPMVGTDPAEKRERPQTLSPARNRRPDPTREERIRKYSKPDFEQAATESTVTAERTAEESGGREDSTGSKRPGTAEPAAKSNARKYGVVFKLVVFF